MQTKGVMTRVQVCAHVDARDPTYTMVDTPGYGIRCPLAPRCKSVLVAWSLEPLARHTQTVNLFCAPLTLPVGQARGVRPGLHTMRHLEPRCQTPGLHLGAGAA